jgi:ATP-binding cassette subfamily B protein
MVVQAGEVLEQGNHDELMALGGLYAQLNSVNYGSFDDLPADAIDTGKVQSS